MCDHWHCVVDVHLFPLQYFTPFITFISELAVIASSLLGLVPSVMCTEGYTVDLAEALQKYEGDLPTPELVEQELLRWKLK